ncbi:hypothetical protein EDD18DRAFT_1106891 [Armillaria luteobubalina]|uniref:Uncharacterized protein n=1 Tax=Armillaria luteobubalina TaxID=153913 RepID=A0AA39Q493_9AGAR|nr:hypothetical protein EDD18DRAFT_1106891 [Armillaria luteobubalina]
MVNTKKAPAPQEESDIEMDKMEVEVESVQGTEVGEDEGLDSAAKSPEQGHATLALDKDANPTTPSGSQVGDSDIDNVTVTPTGNAACLHKQKSKTIEDEPAFTPGPNPFLPLFIQDELLSKKAKQEEKGSDEYKDELLDDHEEDDFQSTPPLDEEDTEQQEESDNDTMKIAVAPQTLVVKALQPAAWQAAGELPAGPVDPFARRLPGAEDDGAAPAPPLPPNQMQSALAPTVPPATTLPGNTSMLTSPPAQDLAMMFAPTTMSNQSTPPASRNESSVTILTDVHGPFGPHSIPPQHVFHNYNSSQVAALFSTRQPGDILAMVWGLEYWNLTYATEARLGAALRAFFPNQELHLQITPPCPPPSYHAKGPLPPMAQKFITNHTGTPFTFYIQGLGPKMKAKILHEGFIPTNLDSYQILDTDDFVMDFVFTIDGLNAPHDKNGQKMVEKLLKDQLYVSAAVWSFLLNHHDTIDPSFPTNDIPSLVILLLEARGIWVEGRKGEPGRQAWNIWIVHPMEVPSFHLQWLSALKSAFPIRSGSGFRGMARVIDIPFFCKGCKGESRPTSLCPLKECLGDVLK